MGKLYDLERRLIKLEKDFENYKTLTKAQLLPIVSDIEKSPDSKEPNVIPTWFHGI